MTSGDLYREAYNKHYKSKDVFNALILYLSIVKDFQESTEYDYAKDQILNIIRSGSVQRHSVPAEYHHILDSIYSPVQTEESIKQKWEEQKQKQIDQQIEDMRISRREIELTKENSEKLSEEHRAWIDSSRQDIAAINDFYEYTTDLVFDTSRGMADQASIQYSLKFHASQGWRLHSIVMNELGKNASSFTAFGITAGTNATIDAALLIYERRIKRS